MERTTGLDLYLVDGHVNLAETLILFGRDREECVDRTLPDATALLAIDVQEGMDDPRRPPRNNPQAEANIARLLDAFRASGRTCVHVRHDSTDPTSPFRPNQPGNAINAIVAPLPGSG